MSMKYERPSTRRMMMHFDRVFLDMLPIFKKGFKGNEIPLLQQEMTPFNAKNQLSILDIGSADGEWLDKTAPVIWNPYDRRKIRLTALEPVVENPKLERYCKEHDVTWSRGRIEESGLADESFDVITSTHSAYYYFNQPLAHEEMFRLLKPDGKLIVTLVSQFCVLNSLTEQLLGPHRQFTLNAESYIGLMSKLGLFSLDRVVAFKGGTIDAKLYTRSVDNLRAIEHVLARHRLTSTDLEEALDPFAAALQRHQAEERINLIMFFSKARLDKRYGALIQRMDDEIGSLRSGCDELASRLSPEKRLVLEGDLETFLAEATRRNPRIAFLMATGDRLRQAAVDARWDANRLKQRIDDVVEKAKLADTV